MKFEQELQEWNKGVWNYPTMYGPKKSEQNEHASMSGQEYVLATGPETDPKTLGILNYELRRFGYNNDNGYGLVVGIVPQDRVKGGRIIKQWSLVYLKGTEGRDGPYIVNEWWGDANGNRGAYYFVYEAEGVTVKLLTPKAGTIVVTDWVSDRTKTAGGKKWTELEASDWLSQIYAKYETCKTAYNKVLETKKKIDEAGGDVSNIIKESIHINDWKNIYADASGHFAIATACFNQLVTFDKGSQRRDILKSKKAREVLKEIFERLYYEEKEHSAWLVKKINDWEKVTDFEKSWQKFKTGVAAPLRGLMLTVIRLNAFNVAAMFENTKQDPEAYDKLRNKFYQMGGNRTKFDEAVKKGSKKPPLGKKKNFCAADGGQVLDDQSAGLDPNKPIDEQASKWLGAKIAGLLSGLAVTIDPKSAPYAVPASVAVGEMVSIAAVAKVKKKVLASGNESDIAAAAEDAKQDTDVNKGEDGGVLGFFSNKWVKITGVSVLVGLAVWGIASAVNQNKKD